MTYFEPDRMNKAVITWAVRITVLCIAIAVVSAAASLAIRALMLLGSSLLSLIHPIVSSISGADPLIQLSLLLVVGIVSLIAGGKFFNGLLVSIGVQGGRA